MVESFHAGSRIHGEDSAKPHELLDYEASQLADQSTFDVATWTVTTQFANSDNFLEQVEAELGSDDEASEDGRTHGAGKSHETSIKLSDDAKASLAAALLKKDNDLAASSHASAKSRCSNFSSSTGNDTNRLPNTAKFALTHKTRAPELANERKKSADLIASQRAMARRIQELEELSAASTSPAKTSRPPRRSIRIAGQTSKDMGAAHESEQGTIVCVNNDSSEEAEF